MKRVRTAVYFRLTGEDAAGTACKGSLRWIRLPGRPFTGLVAFLGKVFKKVVIRSRLATRPGIEEFDDSRRSERARVLFIRSLVPALARARSVVPWG